MKLKAVREGASDLRRRLKQRLDGPAAWSAQHFRRFISAKHERGPARKRARPLLIGLAAALVIGLAAWAAWEIPTTRALVRQSFTRLPDRYIELYFSSPPSVHSGTVTVPITLIDHGDDSVLQLGILARDTSGRVTAQTTKAVQPRRDAPVTFSVDLPGAPDQGQVQVDLLDHPQTLHYRIGNAAAAALPRP